MRPIRRRSQTALLPALGASLLLTSAGAAQQIDGTAGNDVLIGTPLPETVRGLAGDDILRARGGDDLVLGGDGDDQIYWNYGDASDAIDGGPDFDLLRAFAGIATPTSFFVQNDEAGARVLVETNGLVDVLMLHSIEEIRARGSDDVDRMDARSFSDATIPIVFEGQAGKDEIEGGAGPDELFGGSDDDELAGGPGNDFVSGGPGSDLLVWVEGDGSDLLDGGPDNDGANLYFDRGDDDLIWIRRAAEAVRVEVGGITPAEIDCVGIEEILLELGDGDDFVDASTLETDLAVLVEGGDGRDVLIGGPAFFQLDGEAGDDVLEGGPLVDVLRGRAGRDRIIWSAGDDADLIFGGADLDTLEIRGADDSNDALLVSLRAGTAIVGRIGIDAVPLTTDSIERVVLAGYGGDDVIEGVSLDSPLVSSLELEGGEGNDRLRGSLVADRLSGGPGADVFELPANTGIDTIVDLEPADRIDLREVFAAANVTLAPGEDVVDAGYLVLRPIGSNTYLDRVNDIGTERRILMLEGFQGTLGSDPVDPFLVRVSVPEPTVAGGIAIGATGLGLANRRRRRRSQR